jgi:hypothetical protein
MQSVVIGMEATSVYGDNLLYFLREDVALAKFDRKFHVLKSVSCGAFCGGGYNQPRLMG